MKNQYVLHIWRDRFLVLRSLSMRLPFDSMQTPLSLSLSLSQIPVSLGSLSCAPTHHRAAAPKSTSLCQQQQQLPLPWRRSRILHVSLCLFVCVCACVYLSYTDNAAAILDSSTPLRTGAIPLAPARHHCERRKSLLGARVSWESWFMGRIVAAHCSV